MSESVKYIFLFVIRIIAYSLMMVFLYEVMMYDAQHPTCTGKFGEISCTEILQEIFLLLLGFIFIVTGRKDHDLAPLSYLISLFFFMSVIREVNNLVSFWFFLVLPLIILFFWLAYRNRKKLMHSVNVFLQRPEIAWFIAGFLVTYVFSRFFGRRIFWERLMEGDFNRWAKNAAEEATELLGYSLFFIGGIEILWNVLRNKNQIKK